MANHHNWIERILSDYYWLNWYEDEMNNKGALHAAYFNATMCTLYMNR